MGSIINHGDNSSQSSFSASSEPVWVVNLLSLLILRPPAPAPALASAPPPPPPTPPPAPPPN